MQDRTVAWFAFESSSHTPRCKVSGADLLSRRAFALQIMHCIRTQIRCSFTHLVNSVTLLGEPTLGARDPGVTAQCLCAAGPGLRDVELEECAANSHALGMSSTHGPHHEGQHVCYSWCHSSQGQAPLRNAIYPTTFPYGMVLGFAVLGRPLLSKVWSSISDLLSLRLNNLLPH
jgi:hypothetical protein